MNQYKKQVNQILTNRSTSSNQSKRSIAQHCAALRGAAPRSPNKWWFYSIAQHSLALNKPYEQQKTSHEQHSIYLTIMNIQNIENVQNIQTI